MERRVRQHGSSNSFTSSAPPLTGTESVSRWTKAVPRRFWKYLPRLYEKGYIYKGSRIINWCPVCQTSISDAEVEHEEQDGFFWHINYPIVGEEGRFVEIATTSPETLLGDTAVAVNPEDERYKDIIGKMLKLPLTDREIPVIADEYVDKEFGTGCVKITPAHDPNDFEVGKRHNLEEICIMNDDATINVPGKYFRAWTATRREKPWSRI